MCTENENERILKLEEEISDIKYTLNEVIDELNRSCNEISRLRNVW